MAGKSNRADATMAAFHLSCSEFLTVVEDEHDDRDESPFAAGVGLLAVDGSASCFRMRGALVGWSYWCHAARCVSEWEYLLLRRGHGLCAYAQRGPFFRRPMMGRVLRD